MDSRNSNPALTNSSVSDRSVANQQNLTLPKVETSIQQDIVARGQSLAQLNSLAMPSVLQARNQVAGSELPISGPNQAQTKASGPEASSLSATIQDRLSEDMAKVWRDKKSDSGMVEIAKKIGRAIFAFFFR